MEITAKLVKDLRDKTGAGMMDCKKASAKATATLIKRLLSCVNGESPKPVQKKDASHLKASLPATSPRERNLAP